MSSKKKLDSVMQQYVDRQRAWCTAFSRKLVADGVIRDTDTALFTRSLAQVLAKPFDRRLTELETLAALPSVPPIDPAVASVISRGHQIIGSTTLTATYNTEIPRVEIDGREHALTVYGVPAKWYLGYQQIRAAAYAGVPLESSLRDAAARVIAEHVDLTLAYGNASANLRGAWTLAAPPVWQGAVTVTPWLYALVGLWATTATDAQVLADVAAMYEQVRGNLKMYKPTHLAVGTAEFNRMIQPTPMTTYGGPSIVQLIKQAWNLEVVEISRLSTVPAVYRAAGVVGARAALFEKSDEVLYPYVTAGPEEFPPVQQDAGYSITMHQRLGGVESTNPLGIVYLDMA